MARENQVVENLNKEDLKAVSKEQIPELAKNLSAVDVRFLVDALAEKDDSLRYNAFLLLQANSRQSSSVYPYWDVLAEKLESDNSYQRSLASMLIVENVRWDKDCKFAKSISKYLRCCEDEKFITARQAIQGLAIVVGSTDQYNDRIKQELSSMSYAHYKENQQKLLNKDIANVLAIIQNKRK